MSSKHSPEFFGILWHSQSKVKIVKLAIIFLLALLSLPLAGGGQSAFAQVPQVQVSNRLNPQIEKRAYLLRDWITDYQAID